MLAHFLSTVKPLLFLSALVLLLAGCDSPTSPEEPEAPSISIETPEGEQSGDVTLSFSVEHPEGEPTDLAVSFTAPDLGGEQPLTVKEASAGTVEMEGDSLSLIEDVPSGEHTFVWDSEADLEDEDTGLFGREGGAEVSLSWIDDGEPQPGDETRPFRVDNLHGEELWRFETGGWVTSPAVVDGMVYVGSSWDTHLYAVDAETGEEGWKFEAKDFVSSLPAVADGIVYAGCLDNHLYAVDAGTGQEEWRFEMGWGVESSPTVVDGVVYFGSRDDYLYAVDAEAGQEEWCFQTEGNVRSSPAVVDGVVYVGSYDDHLYAIAD